jgi:23S rRNA (guanine745-N1)-methyltransferase
MQLPLACPVRGCGQPLERRVRDFACPQGHTHDIARSGYINLLQPQDRRSARAGDTRDAVGARSRLLATGVGRTIVESFAHRAAALDLDSPAIVVDLGSGSGDALATLAQIRPIEGTGIDLSAVAAAQAARRFPSLTWVVANADRRLPLLDHSVDLVLSLHGRRNPSECARVLKKSGFLFVAVPAVDDLIELRASIQGRGLERDRATALRAEHSELFTLLERAGARERPRLEHDALVDLLHGTYRGARASAAARVDALATLDVTIASDFFLFAPRRETP